MSYRVKGVLSPEAASPLPTSKGFSGNAISFFSGVRAEAVAERFSCILRCQAAYSGTILLNLTASGIIPEIT